MHDTQLVMYDEDFRKVLAVTQRLVKDANAKGVFVVDRNGQLISEAGEMRGIDTTSLASLSAGSVAATGGLANWMLPERGVGNIGGAMDLAAGVKTIRVITQHCTKTGESKLMEACTYPLTGKGIVKRIYTDLAVIDVTPEGFRAVELAPGVTFDYLKEKTACRIIDGTGDSEDRLECAS